MKRIFVHIGYPKTGTTTLQQDVFDKLHRKGLINYLGMFGFQSDGTPDRALFFNGLTSALYCDTDEEFELVSVSLRRQLSKLIDRDDTSLPTLLSNEHFVLSQYSTRQRGKTIVVERTARRLAHLLRGLDVNFLVSLRRQDRLAWSLFLEHRSRAVHANAKEYLDVNVFYERLGEVGQLGNDCMNFDHVLSVYRKHFPGAKICSWLFEDFQITSRPILIDIFNFLEIPQAETLVDIFHLTNRNARSRGDGTVQVEKRFGIRAHLASLARRGGFAGVLRQLGLDRSLKRLLPIQRIAPPEQPVRAKLLESFEQPNFRLAQEFESLAGGMQRHGYFPGTIDKLNSDKT